MVIAKAEKVVRWRGARRRRLLRGMAAEMRR
jgi:hypothetical protein